MSGNPWKTSADDLMPRSEPDAKHSTPKRDVQYTKAGLSPVDVPKRCTVEGVNSPEKVHCITSDSTSHSPVLVDTSNIPYGVEQWRMPSHD
jgi:hypothetical protein